MHNVTLVIMIMVCEIFAEIFSLCEISIENYPEKIRTSFEIGNEIISKESLRKNE